MRATKKSNAEGASVGVSASRAGADSWMTLLASTSLGVGSAKTLSAVVRAGARAEPGGPTTAGCDRPLRLVVQSYDAPGGKLPGKQARPVGSMQRSVTADELREGVHVSFVELRGEEQTRATEPVVVAWLEDGDAELEFDGRRARPKPGAMFGSAPRKAVRRSIEISLEKVVAA